MPRPRLERPNFRKRFKNGKRGGSWYIDFTDPDSGKGKSVSVGSVDEKAADAWIQQALAGYDNPAPPPAPTIAEILDGYLEDRTGIVVDHDRLKFAAQAVKRHIGHLRPDQMGARLFWRLRSGDGVGPGTIGKDGRTLRSALAWAKRAKWIAEEPFVELPGKPAPKMRFLSRDEADRLLEACPTPHLRLFVLVALHTAARKGAILELTWDQVDLHRRLIHFQVAGRAETKKRRATVPINDTLIGALQEAHLVRTSDHVIEYRGEAIDSIKTAFNKAVKRARIAHCTRHDLRRTSASWMVMAGVPIEEVANFLGDTPEMVRAVYGRFSPDYLRRAASALDGRKTPREVSSEKTNLQAGSVTENRGNARINPMRTKGVNG